MDGDGGKGEEDRRRLVMCIREGREEQRARGRRVNCVQNILERTERPASLPRCSGPIYFVQSTVGRTKRPSRKGALPKNFPVGPVAGVVRPLA